MADQNQEQLAVDLKKALRKESILETVQDEDLAQASEKIAKKLTEKMQEGVEDIFEQTEPVQPSKPQEPGTAPSSQPEPAAGPEPGAPTEAPQAPAGPQAQGIQPTPEQATPQAMPPSEPTVPTTPEPAPTEEPAEPEPAPEAEQEFQPFTEEPPFVTEPEQADKEQAEQEKAPTAEEQDKQRAAEMKAGQRREQVAQQKAAGDINAQKFAQENNVDLEGNVSGDPRSAAAGKVGEVFGKELSQRIATGSFKAFAIALTLALIKDGGDLAGWVDAGTFSYFILLFVDGVIAGALTFIVMSQTGWLKQRIQRFFIRRFIGTICIEFLPWGEFIPFYTVMIILIKRDADKERKKHEGALRKLQDQMNLMSRKPIPKGRQLERVSAAMKG